MTPNLPLLQNENQSAMTAPSQEDAGFILQLEEMEDSLSSSCCETTCKSCAAGMPWLLHLTLCRPLIWGHLCLARTIAVNKQTQIPEALIMYNNESIQLTAGLRDTNTALHLLQWMAFYKYKSIRSSKQHPAASPAWFCITKTTKVVFTSITLSNSKVVK